MLYEYQPTALAVREYVMAYRLWQKLDLQIKAFGRMGADAAFLDQYEPMISALRLRERKYKDRIGDTLEGTTIGDWAESTAGLSANNVGLILGCLPCRIDHMVVKGTDNRCPSPALSYLGLDPVNGKSRKRERGKHAGFNVLYRSFVIYRMGEPCMKCRTSPYRAIYDKRREHTMDTHPSMFVLVPDDDGKMKETRELTEPDCPSCNEAIGASKKERAEKNQTRERTTVAWDCAHYGGIHWKRGHRHADAMRVMSKQIVIDMWRVGSGMEPRHTAIAAELVAA